MKDGAEAGIVFLLGEKRINPISRKEEEPK
jgi:hypothetical protein